MWYVLLVRWADLSFTLNFSEAVNTPVSIPEAAKSLPQPLQVLQLSKYLLRKQGPQSSLLGALSPEFISESFSGGFTGFGEKVSL